MATKQKDDAKHLIGEEKPAEDYKKLIKENVEEYEDDETRIANFEKFSAEMRKVIYSIIFKTKSDSKEKILLALKAYRDEAGFYNPYDYNDWIKEIKSKLIEKQMLDIWEDVIVKDQLGLLWAKDCDFFDDMDDKEPKDFYKINNQSTSNGDSKRIKLTNKTAENESATESEKESLETSKKSEDESEIEDIEKVTSVDHYLNLVKEKVTEIDPDEEYKKMTIFDHLSDQVRDILTDSILKTTDVDNNKMVKEIKIYRDEACFYNPYDYNDWIKEIKKKVIEQKMFDFWENVIVKKQLGLLWARDCDFFDDINDQEPKKFYKINPEGANDDESELVKIGFLTPADDYKNLVEREVEEIDSDREDEKMDIFDNLSKQIQDVIDSLIFNDENKDLEKAATALKTYRDEACFYNPYDYNDWIKEIKAKIIEKKMFEFWENFIIKNKLGLLWARDCDFFDDMDDKEPDNFYKIQK